MESVVVVVVVVEKLLLCRTTIGNSLAPDDEDGPGRRHVENDNCDDCGDRPGPHGTGGVLSVADGHERPAGVDEPTSLCSYLV